MSLSVINNPGCFTTIVEYDEKKIKIYCVPRKQADVFDEITIVAEDIQYRLFLRILLGVWATPFFPLSSYYAELIGYFNFFNASYGKTWSEWELWQWVEKYGELYRRDAKWLDLVWIAWSKQWKFFGIAYIWCTEGDICISNVCL